MDWYSVSPGILISWLLVGHERSMDPDEETAVNLFEDPFLHQNHLKFSEVEINWEYRQ